MSKSFKNLNKINPNLRGPIAIRQHIPAMHPTALPPLPPCPTIYPTGEL